MTHMEFFTRMELKSLTQQSECAGAESGCLRMLSECLSNSSMRLGVLFIAPRQLGAVGDQSRKAKLALCRVVHRAVRCAISFLFCPVNYSRTPPNISRERPVHRKPAWRTGHCPVHHRIVRCARPSWTLAAHSQVFCNSFFSCF
jgi:hypothetical protein